MARTKSADSSANKKVTTTKSQPTVAELREWYANNENRMRSYELAEDQIKRLRDVAKNPTPKSLGTYTKEGVVNYLQNPGQNEKNLRNLSRYLFYRSNIYFRICEFFANFPMLSARQVIPRIDLNKGLDQNKALKSYNDTLELLDRMNLVRNFKKVFSTVFREDVFYGIYWIDDTGMIIIPWDPDYGKITGITSYGNYIYSMDMTWFRSRQDILEFWGEPFTTMYNNYLKDGQKWQEVGEQGICIKFRDDWELVVPPFSGMFIDLMNLLTLQDLQSVKDEQDVFKLVYAKLETMDNKSSDEFCVSPDLKVQYFNVFKELLPSYIACGILPGNSDLGVIDFADNQDSTATATKTSKAITQVLNTAGGGEVLDGTNINNTYAYKCAMINNTRFALTSIIPQVEAWLAMVADQQLSNPAKIHLFMVSPYTKDDFQDDLLEAAQNGLPTALPYNTLNEMSEIDTMALLEMQSILGIPDKLVPLSTSYTQSGSGGEVGQGRDKLPDDELEPSTDRSRNA